MKKTAILLIIILISACSKDDKRIITELCPDFLIRFSTGSGWTGWHFDVTVRYPDIISFYEQSNIPVPGEQHSEFRLSQNEVDSLFEDVKAVSRIRLRNYGFGPDKPTDLPYTSVKYMLCNCIDSAAFYSPEENELPEEVLTLLDRISTLITEYYTEF